MRLPRNGNSEKAAEARKLVRWVVLCMIAFPKNKNKEKKTNKTTTPTKNKKTNKQKQNKKTKKTKKTK